MEVIHVGQPNTVRTLRDQLAKLVAAGYSVTGFPILQSDVNGESRMLGFIGGNELEHALSTSTSASCLFPRVTPRANQGTACLGIVAEKADHPVSFQPSLLLYRSFSTSSMSSVPDHPEDPFDFSVYMDKVCPSHETIRRSFC